MVNVPAVGADVTMTDMNAFGGLSSGSLNPKSAVWIVTDASSSVVVEPLVPAGGSLTESMVIEIVPAVLVSPWLTL